MKNQKDHIRGLLIRKLQREHVFWSYEKPRRIRDDILIEKTLVHLDIEDINQLFLLFPKEKIRTVWEEKVLPIGGSYRSVNLLFAYLYFDIKDPEAYLEEQLHKHHQQQMHLL